MIAAVYLVSSGYTSTSSAEEAGNKILVSTPLPLGFCTTHLIFYDPI